MVQELIIGDAISTEEACKLLQISRPTFKKLIKKNAIKEFLVHKKCIYSKTEILYQLFTKILPFAGENDFLDLPLDDLSKIQIDENTFDLRLIRSIDAHGAIAVICQIVNLIGENRYIHLLCSEKNSFLKKMNFFGALKIFHGTKIFWDEEVVNRILENDFPFIKMPITRLSGVGQHQKILDELTSHLKKQNFSDEICAYVGWAIGELVDNAIIHAKVAPAFATLLECSSKGVPSLQFTIADTGIGIAESLKGKECYCQLSNEQAILTAFKSNVISRSDEEKRGKGLTDVLKIAIESHSSVTLESYQCSYKFAFHLGVDNFLKKTPLFKGKGTLITFLFFDGHFSCITRKEVDQYIDKCLEKL